MKIKIRCLNPRNAKAVQSRLSGLAIKWYTIKSIIQKQFYQTNHLKSNIKYQEQSNLEKHDTYTKAKTNGKQ